MWKEWFAKLAWMLISFKVWSFTIVMGLLVFSWRAAEEGISSSISVAKSLHENNFINSEQLTNIITHSQTAYLDSLMGHISVLGSAVLVSIIALKAATDWQSIAKDKEVIKKVSSKELSNGGLKKFLSKAGQ